MFFFKSARNRKKEKDFFSDGSRKKERERFLFRSERKRKKQKDFEKFLFLSEKERNRNIQKFLSFLMTFYPIVEFFLLTFLR